MAERKLDDEFPVPLSRFLPLIAGTPYEVFGKLLSNAHGLEKRTERGWMQLVTTVYAR